MSPLFPLDEIKKKVYNMCITQKTEKLTTILI